MASPAEPASNNSSHEVPPTTERIGVLFVHGIGEQRTFEHLESEVRNLLRAIRQQVGECTGEARVTLQVRTTQDSAYLNDRETWKAESGAPVAIDIKYADGRRNQSIEFREVWWADLDEPASLWNAIRFWFWGLSLWARPAFANAPQPSDKGGVAGTTLPGAELMIAPGRDREVDEAPDRPPTSGCYTRVHLFFAATIFTLLLATLIPLNWLLKKLTIIRFRPADILVRYLADVKLYQQAKRRDLWPLVDMGRPPRVMIRRRTVRAMTDIAQEGYDRWYLLAHSLGTVVACNGLMETAHSLPNYLDKERWQRALASGLGGLQRPGIDEMKATTDAMMPARPVWLEDNHVLYRDRLFLNFRGILTYGSPLDKFAALFPATVPLNRNAAVYAPGTQWINIHDPTDPVAGELDYFKTPREAHPPLLPSVTTIEPINHAYAARWILLYSHICYLKFEPDRNDRLVNCVTEWLLSGKAFCAPAAGSPGWPDARQAAMRRVWRQVQNALVVVLATSLLAWLFNPILRDTVALLASFDNWFGRTVGTALQTIHGNATAFMQMIVAGLAQWMPVFIAKCLLYLLTACLFAGIAGESFVLGHWLNRKLREWRRNKTKRSE